MKVLVTGHRGYLGTVMAPMLLRAGHTVVGCDSDLYSDCTFPKGGKIADIVAMQMDVRDIQQEALVGFDAVESAFGEHPLSGSGGRRGVGCWFFRRSRVVSLSVFVSRVARSRCGRTSRERGVVLFFVLFIVLFGCSGLHLV